MTGHEQPPLTPLTMAILLALADGDRHGYALMEEVERQTDGALTPGTGSLYGALQRLMAEGLVAEIPGAFEPGPGRPRRVFGITDAGRDEVRAESRRLLKVLRLARERSLAPDADEPLLRPAEGSG